MNIVYTLPVPDNQSTLFIEAFAKCNGWNENNELTALEFGKKTIDTFVKNQVVSYLAMTQAEQARQQATAEFNTQLGLITSTINLE